MGEASCPLRPSFPAWGARRLAPDPNQSAACRVVGQGAGARGLSQRDGVTATLSFQTSGRDGGELEGCSAAVGVFSGCPGERTG